MSRLALQGAAAYPIIPFALDDGLSMQCATSATFAAAVPPSPAPLAGLDFEGLWAGPLQTDGKGWCSPTRSWKRRRRGYRCAARWAFRHSLALKAQLADLVPNESDLVAGFDNVFDEDFSHMSGSVDKQVGSNEELEVKGRFSVTCTPSPRKHPIEHTPDKHVLKRFALNRDGGTDLASETCTTEVPPVSAGVAGAASAGSVMLNFALTPLPDGTLSRRRDCLDPIDWGFAWLSVPNDHRDSDFEDFSGEYTGFECVTPEEEPLALSPPPPVQEGIWPQIRRFIDEHSTREKESGTFPSTVFSRKSSFRLWLSETFAGLNEETFELAVNYLIELLEQHVKFQEMHPTSLSSSWGSGGSSSTRTKPQGKKSRR